MSSVVIHVVVEGQTEQTFVREVLAPEIAKSNKYLYPALFGHKGGNFRFDKVKKDIGEFLKQRNDTYITTMFDFFRIDSRWPGLADLKQKLQSGITLNASEKAEMLEIATKSSIVELYSDSNAENRFFPYISMHEFEALLFSDADVLAEYITVNRSEINQILKNYNNNPENINDDSERAPSKQIKKLTTSFDKVAMGKTISEAIGIQTMREKCPHFNTWLQTLENLSPLEK